MENADDHEQSTETADGYKRVGKILGVIGIIFNTVGIVFLLAYDANPLNVLFNVVFWMFVLTLFACISWLSGVAYDRFWLLIPALICWTIQFLYCLCWTLVWFLIKLFTSKSIVGGLLTILFTCIGGFIAIVVSVVYFFFAVKVFLAVMSTTKCSCLNLDLDGKNTMDVSYTPASTDADVC